MNNALVTLRDVQLRYGPRLVLNNINLEIHRGEITTVIGPNGAGKSCLVKLVTGLETPTEGGVLRNSTLKIGYMPQFLALDRSMPIKVGRFLSLVEQDKGDRKHVLERLEIMHLAGAQIQSLSGGEFQRVLLARAILRQPDLLVLDEPLQGVDVNGQIALYRLIASLRDELNCAILMVSHDLHLVMAQTDNVICLNQHVCCHGRPENVSRDPEYLRMFGPRAAEDIAFYSHQHDHHHDIHGNVVECGEHDHNHD